jgi:hypothetical protein
VRASKTPPTDLAAAAGTTTTTRRAPRPRTQDTDGDQAAFNSALQAQFAPALRDAEQLYLSCGQGGGAGFQSLPANQGPTVPPVFEQTFGVGGGGWAFVVFNRTPAGSDVNDINLLTSVDLAQLSGLARQFLAKLGDDRDPRPAGNPAFAQRGLYASDGAQRFTGSLGNARVVYEPYAFPIADPSTATADTVYISGSNSPAGLFFASGGADGIGRDVTRLTGGAVAGVLYTINVNPTEVQYGGGTPVVRDINDTVLDALDAAGIRITLAIPLAIQHDADGVSQQPPIVTANKETLDYAVAALAKHDSVDGIVVDTGEHAVIKGFFRPATASTTPARLAAAGTPRS